MATHLRTLFSIVTCTMILACSSPTRQKQQSPIIPIDSTFMSHVDLVLHHPDSAIRWVQDCMSTAPDSIAFYCWNLHLGRCYYYNSEWDSALVCTDRTNAFGYRSPYSADIATILSSSYNIRGAILQWKNERDSALACYKEAYRNVQQASSRREMSNICVNAANVCEQMGRFSDATIWYHQALQAADSLGMETMKHCIYSGLGMTYSYMNNFRQAEWYFSQVDSLYPPQTDYEAHVYYTSRGNSYMSQNKHKEALAYDRKTYQAADKLQVRSVQAISEANIGDSFLALGQLDSARYYLERANVYFASDPMADDAIRFYINGLFASLALQEGNLQEANRYLSMPFDKERVGAYYLYLYHKVLMKYYGKVKDFAHAYQYQEIVRKYDDSLRNVRYQNSVTEIDYRYRQDTTLLKRDIIIANSRNKVTKLQSTVAIGSSIFLLFLIATVFTYWHLRRKHERQRRKQLSLITQLRMENVRNRFSPHFVFNVLNAVIPSFWKYESEALPLRQLVQALRGSLLITDRIAIPLKEEISLVENYVALRQVTNPLLPKVEWIIEKSVDLSLHLPSMIIQVPVENALKHAFPTAPTEEEPQWVKIRIANEAGSFVRITIEDNGIGYGKSISPEPAKNGTRTGIRILHRTLELLNERNAQKITLEIHDCSVSGKGEHGTIVTISVPQSYNYEI